MRQNQRCLRPGIELCNDKAQHALQAEINNLKTSMLSLDHQLGLFIFSFSIYFYSNKKFNQKIDFEVQKLCSKKIFIQDIKKNTH